MLLPQRDRLPYSPVYPSALWRGHSPAPERLSLTVQGKISFVKLRNHAMYRALAVNRVMLWFYGCSGTWESNLSRRIWAGEKPPPRNRDDFLIVYSLRFHRQFGNPASMAFRRPGSIFVPKQKKNLSANLLWRSLSLLSKGGTKSTVRANGRQPMIDSFHFFYQLLAIERGASLAMQH